jgi:ABC-2 type transport system ATP-binding protein
MRRRLDLAASLVGRPAVLFLDEPTTGLDPASRAAIWEEVRRLNAEQGMTIFLTTQYLEEADRLADQIAIINHGRIAASGTPGELKRQVGDEVVELAFADDAQAARADEALHGVAPSRQAAGHELRLYFPRAAENVPELVRTLDAAGLQPTGLLVTQPTLDDVFLRITGEELDPGERHDPLTPEGDGAPGEPGGAPPGDRTRQEVRT